ncbi:MAG: hypothetical protein WAL98_13480 [Desulfatiglandaceae bacterium]
MTESSFVHSTLEDGEDLYLTDQWKRKYHFKIASFPVPTGMAFEAIEVKADNALGYQFNSLSSFDTDPAVAKQAFIKKIRKGLNQRHLKKVGSEWEIGGRDILRGRIEWNDDLSDTDLDRVFVIDGKRITIDDFGRMLGAYEGWRFEFRILDPYSQSCP